MNKLGTQCQEAHQAVIDYNRLVKPKAIMGTNVLDRQFWQTLQNDNPNCLMIFRHYPNFNWAEDPEEQAIAAVKAIGDKISGIDDLINAVLDNNEYIHAHMTSEWHLADRYMAKFIPECRAKLGKLPIVLNAATGNFSHDITTAFPQMLATLEQMGGFIGWHEYDWPTMWRIHEEDIANGGEGMWHSLRWKRAAKVIKEAGYQDIRFLITECGVDSGVIGISPNQGWRLVYPDNFQASLENYVKSLEWYNWYLADPDVYAALIFGCGMVSPWESFDIKGTEIPQRISQFKTEEVIGMEIRDLEGRLRDKEWLREWYGIKWKSWDEKPGEKIYRLVGLYEQEGTVSLITKVVDGQDEPMENVDVALYWPDAPGPPDPPTDVRDHDWYPNFVHGPTNVNGDVGPGMGTGAYHGKGECGGHSVWVRDPNIRSDLCECLGMLGMTNHRHMNQKFKLIMVHDPDDLKVVARLEEDHETAMLYVIYPTKIAYDTCGKAGIVGSEIELECSNPEAFDWSGFTWAMIGVCCHFTEDETREYWLEVHNCVSDAPVVPRVSEEFGPNEQRKVIYVMDFAEPEEPSPSPEPEEVWTMTVERQPGIRLLIGKGLPTGTDVTIVAPWGASVTVTAGSKPEHDPVGGWETPIWHTARYVVGFLEELFEVDVGDETVILTFTLAEPPEQKARLVSEEMLLAAAEELLEELEGGDCGGIFSVEEL